MKTFLRNSTILFALLLAPIINFAQAPPLGATANFILFTSNGAVGNTGISQITGNVGTNIGAITGFGNVNGRMHSGDLVTAQAASDLQTAYTALNNTIPTYFPASPLGNGDTLIAGVYSITGVSVLNSTLVLNALGDTNAVFIFQLSAAFSTNPNSGIKLINGARACNVFWKVEGAVSMAAGSSMKGTIIANNAAISMNANDTLEGRALSTTGSITINNVLAYTPVGCGSPHHTGPAAPNLGSAACYAIFSGNGAVTNSGVTYATGDIGTNVGLTTGYNPLNVTGTIHPIPDASTAAAVNDLVIAYNYLNTLPYDIELLYPAQFGNDLVLTPHTYLLNAATTFTNSLFLNAEGDSNAVFVIQINGAITTSTYSKVILTNGAQAKNVFWKVDGAVSINDYSVFNGTIICNNGAINLNTGDSINGRALTTNGALSTTAVVVTSPSAPCSIPLAVNWQYFHGEAQQSSVHLRWAIAEDAKSDFFNIEKSEDGKVFETLGKVDAAVLNGQVENSYTYTDLSPFTVGYYRIKQVYLDGRSNYSHTIRIALESFNDFNASQYIDGGNIYVKTTGALSGNGSIELYNIEGKKITSQKIVLTNQSNTYQINKPMQPGIYLMRIVSDRHVLYSTKLTVQ